MSTLTNKLKMEKPDSTDNVSPDAYNRNFDIIDEEITALKKDYVIDQGYEGNWVYRRWNSGIAEVWGRHQTKSTNLYGLGLTVMTPEYPFAFIEAPIVQASFYTESDAYAGIRYVNSTPRQPQVYGYSQKFSEGNMCVFMIYSIGRWKE